jgi:hypothetical protein
MRHFLSVVLSIILAPLIYVAAGLAAVKLDSAHIDSSSINWTAAEIGLGAGVVAGALYAVLVMARISPIGPFIAGLAYLGMTTWAFLDDTSFQKVFDFDIFSLHRVLLQPAGAGLLLLAIPLIATIFSRRRWQPGTPAGLPYDAAPAYPPSPSSAAPEYGEVPTLTGPTYQVPAYPSYGSSYSTETTETTAPAYQPPAYQPSVYTPPTTTPYTPSYAQPETPAVDPMDTWPTYSPEARTTDQS